MFIVIDELSLVADPVFLAQIKISEVEAWAQMLGMFVVEYALPAQRIIAPLSLVGYSTVRIV